MTADTIRKMPVPAVRGASAARASVVFIKRSLLHSLRDGEGLIMAIALPVVLMLLFTLVFGGAIGGAGYLNYVVPGVILLCAAYGSSSVAVSVNRDVAMGAMRRFRTLPIRSSTVLIGHAVASILRNLLATAVVIGVALAIGFRPGAGPGEWFGALGIVTAWIVAITLLFAFVGLVSSSPEAANGYGFFLLFLPYLSSAFVPIDTMPAWLRPVAEHQPINPLVESIRGLLLGGDVPAGTALAWCAGIVVVVLGLIAWRFPKQRDR